MRLQIKLMLGISFIILMIGSFFGITYAELVEKSLKKEKGLKALSLAQTLAVDDDIIAAFATSNPAKIIQPIAEEVRQEVNAEFIVIGNKEGIRYSHPKEDRLGKKMIGGDNELAFQGKASVFESIGSLGPSIRGKAPIFNENKEVVGVVSVGYLETDIAKEVRKVKNKILVLTIVILMGGIIAAFLLSQNIKRALFGLEPKEIARMYLEKHTILESIHEGIIAIDKRGHITVVNEKAHKMLNVPLDRKLRGTDIRTVVKNTHLLDVVGTGKAEYDREMFINSEVFVTNRIPIHSNNGYVIGAVASLRNKSELSKVLQELSHMRSYAEGLRAQTHEYSNKMYTLLGLIQLESYKEAIELITDESDVAQEQLSFLMTEIPDHIIAGCILGKYSLASEKKIEFQLDRESSFVDVPTSIGRNELVTIIGNLVNNAFDAVLENHSAQKKKVSLFLTDLGKELIIEVSDNGVGISSEYYHLIFDEGFSTKHSEHNSGLGLRLVKNAVEHLGGTVTFYSELYKGTTFTIAIPKSRGGSG
ncbi:sensor histidine kinase [Bacillus sp. JJ722]|uniref:sensor histidine kinase n=1 Tax=Bacillus sp. JJ722 TaxID=3122973 RepID=UPI002FFFB41F